MLMARLKVSVPGGLVDQHVDAVGDQGVGAGRQQVAQLGQLRLDGGGVENQAVNADDHGYGREQRQRGVEGAAGGHQGDTRSLATSRKVRTTTFRQSAQVTPWGQ
jgi:hypothetical protein